MATLLPDPEETDRVLITLASEAHKHARQHLIAARAVLDAGIWSVAFANVALVLEELGKALICTSALSQPHEQRLANEEWFRKAFNSHEMKALCAFMTLGMVNEEMPEGLEELFKLALRDARRTHKNKMRGFYTDSNASGHVLKPSDITEEQARQLLQVVEALMTLSAESEEALEDPEGYLRVLGRMRQNEAYQAAYADLDDDDSLDELGAQTITAARLLARAEVPFPEAVKGTWIGPVVDELIADLEDRAAAAGLPANFVTDELAAMWTPAAPGEHPALPTQPGASVTEAT
ncbi:AbiV family abortive infection protein [Streptomyces sp. NPDC046324]|uniref:AbiV family abortive infection protein n=1 Tax=Streptomyces sp. NPDC046324 TaxID=3154915 RepID=UPI0033C4EC3D